jgi:hypothetical protein
MQARVIDFHHPTPGAVEGLLAKAVACAATEPERVSVRPILQQFQQCDWHTDTEMMMMMTMMMRMMRIYMCMNREGGREGGQRAGLCCAVRLSHSFENMLQVRSSTGRRNRSESIL